MDPITQQTLLAAAGAGGDKVYVDDVFSTTLYKGNSSNQATLQSQQIINGIDLSGEGGLVWSKSRSAGSYWSLWDTVRTLTGSNNWIRCDSTNIATTTGQVTGFNNNGYTLGEDNTHQVINYLNRDYVSWTFRKQEGFFDIVTYTGNGSGQTVAHNLGSVPGMIIYKALDANFDWMVYHRSTGASKYGKLQETREFLTGGDFNNTAPDANNFYLGGSGAVNGNNKNFVAYIFAHDDASFGTDGNESIIKCGTYTGGGSTSVEVNLGFEPQWVLIKSADTAYSWWVVDNMRGISPGDDAGLSPNSTATENGYDLLDLTATGFKTGTNANANKQGDTFIYMAIRRPNKPVEVATEVFGLSTQSASPYPSFTSGFPVDFFIKRDGMSNAGNDNNLSSRLQGSEMLKSNTSDGETGYGAIGWDYMTGFAEENQTVSGNYAYMFKRAPGFMDVVKYQGTSSSITLTHNLGVVPELQIVKASSSSSGNGRDWIVFTSKIDGSNDYLKLNATDNANDSTQSIPTATTFTFSGSGTPSNSLINGSIPYVTYLFATLPGISKVGKYTATGNAINVDCGFTNGARFVLIKRTDTSGNWFVFDTLRGIVSGNDPFFELNTSSAQDSNYDNLDPYNQGFTVTAYGGSSPYLNISGATYLFLAIA